VKVHISVLGLKPETSHMLFIVQFESDLLCMPVDNSSICGFVILRTQGRINHSGAPYQSKVGALFSYAQLWFSMGVLLWGALFLFSSPQKLTTLF